MIRWKFNRFFIVCPGKLKFYQGTNTNDGGTSARFCLCNGIVITLLTASVQLFVRRAKEPHHCYQFRIQIEIHTRHAARTKKMCHKRLICSLFVSFPQLVSFPGREHIAHGTWHRPQTQPHEFLLY